MILNISVFPNPFNAITTIDFSLPQPDHVTVNIHNTLGQCVATLIDGALPAGLHSTFWDARGHSTGLYFCRIASGGHAATRKLMLVK